MSPAIPQDCQRLVPDLQGGLQERDLQKEEIMNYKLILPCLLLLLGINQKVVAEPKEFSAEYTGKFQGLPFKARALRKLRKLEDGTYRLTSSARAMFITVSEVSEFAMAGDRVVPIRYLYQRKGIGKNRDESALFNWLDLTVNYKDNILDIQPGTLDKLLYQYQLREDVRRLMSRQATRPGSESLDLPLLSYQIPDDGRLKEYRFRITGQELLNTPLGDTPTVRVDRIREDDKRQTTLWLATEHEYLLVRLRHAGKNNKMFEINISAINHLAVE